MSFCQYKCMTGLGARLTDELPSATSRVNSAGSACFRGRAAASAPHVARRVQEYFQGVKQLTRVLGKAEQDLCLELL
jgi:hypothetical protein